eukprot:TRINITY_DN55907_c0_g1_i1.p1 TRINITY_DN55907_c0_g1~~TRINITY_DN55907_c0_g1_i1.p1  ORF type:complete len:314 (-),score=73.87 TRINITY_DN55907_c0_g1_i1:45-986(-)
MCIRDREDPSLNLDMDLRTRVRAAVAKGGVIVYCHKRVTCDSVRALLASELGNSDRVAAYHSGVTGKDERTRIVQQWQTKELSVIVATVSFGMGIDRSDVRLVVHYDPPKSIEGLLQEFGRAARDGSPAETVLYFSQEDQSLMRFLGDKNLPKNKAQAGTRKESLAQLERYCGGGQCRRRVLLEYFGEEPTPDKCANCDVCLDVNTVAANLAAAENNVMKSRWGDLGSASMCRNMQVEDAAQERDPWEGEEDPEDEDEDQEQELVDPRLASRWKRMGELDPLGMLEAMEAAEEKAMSRQSNMGKLAQLRRQWD